MVEPLHRDAALEQPLQRRAVAVERDVEHGDAVARAGVGALEERDVALRAGDEAAFGRRRKAELVQGAEPVGVAVEDVEPYRLPGFAVEDA
ncbi:MAG TPA: hypothetical protein VML91_20150 [Burkholderiales bacterium]|nr:hypothetical protein [Burkholderiales bacterium]